MRNTAIALTSVAVALAFMSGCTTTGTNIDLQCTHTWENHYMTVEDFKAGTLNIELNGNESVWVLSNQTLNRLLTNEKRTAQ